MGVDLLIRKKVLCMQLHLQLSGSFALPLNYRHYIQSMIYDALRTDPDFSAALHDGGTEKRRFKLFTFGQLGGSYRIADRRILFHSGASLEIRSIHEELLLRLFRRFTPGTALRLGSATVTVGHAALTNTAIVDAAVTVRACSPIVAYITQPDGYTRFFSPADNRYFIKSERMPLQTTVLGTLRYLLMPVKNAGYSYSSEERMRNAAVIGPDSFVIGSTVQSFGAIKKIHPLYLALFAPEYSCTITETASNKNPVRFIHRSQPSPEYQVGNAIT